LAAVTCLDCSLGLADDFVTTKLPLQSPKLTHGRSTRARLIKKSLFLAVLVNERGLHDIAVLRTIQSANAVFSRADCISHPRGKRGVHSNNVADCVVAEQ